MDTNNNYRLTKSSNLQTNLFYAKRTISSFNNFSDLIHYIQNFGDQCKIKWRKRKKKTDIERRKMKERKRTRKREERGGRFRIYD